MSFVSGVKNFETKRKKNLEKLFDCLLLKIVRAINSVTILRPNRIILKKKKCKASFTSRLKLVEFLKKN